MAAAGPADASAGGHPPQGAGAKAALFNDQASSYGVYRPTYPKELYDAVLQFGFQGLSLSTGRELALDVATGTGQARRAARACFGLVRQLFVLFAGSCFAGYVCSHASKGKVCLATLPRQSHVFTGRCYCQAG
jgi:hypothetical protein